MFFFSFTVNHRITSYVLDHCLCWGRTESLRACMGSGTEGWVQIRFFFWFCVLAMHVACGILVLLPGIEPTHSLGSESRDSWPLDHKGSPSLLFPYCCLLTKLYPTLLRTPMDGHSPPDSSVHGISQARILECVTIVLGAFRKLLSSPKPQFPDMHYVW